MSTADCVLAINAGSSSVRFAQFEVGEPHRLRLRGKLDRVGSNDASLAVTDADGKSQTLGITLPADGALAAGSLLDWVEAQPAFESVAAVGHRVVHGMSRSEPEQVTPELLDALLGIVPYAPEHLPREIKLIEEIRKRHPRLPQVACFDTAFHQGMPQVAKLLPIPRRYGGKGIRRYGFHGLSFQYLMEELARDADASACSGRVILAHLGNGASLAAVRNGKCIDTSMSFTPAAGLMMSTRTGDMDPGLFCYLAQTEKMSVSQLQHMVNHESGLLGVSEISADLRDLLARETTDGRAADAVALFCYQAKKWIGSFAAALGGLDTLVFAGGIGENAPLIRKRICAGLGFLGVALTESRNAANAAVISPDTSAVSVRVIRTDEEITIARLVSRHLGLAA